jgi:hypothetical protein
MKEKMGKGVKVIFMIIAGLFFAALFAGVVMYLWNWLMPDLFGLNMIGYWQAIGIIILSRILFGSWSGNSGMKKCKHCAQHNEQSKGDKYSMKARFMEKWAECKDSRESSTVDSEVQK